MSEPSPERQAAIVGLFVAFGLAILIGALVAVGALSERLGRTVDVHAVFHHVGGLQAGDAVWFSGVRIGTVTSVRFSEGAVVEVDLALERDASPFVRADAEARIGTDGLIGNPIVVLAGGTADAGPVEDGEVLATVEALSAEQVLATFQENNRNLVAVTRDLRALTARLQAGEGTAGRLLQDDALYDDLAATVGELRRASAHANVASADLAAFGARLEGKGPALEATMDRLDAVAADAARVVDVVEAGTSDPDTPIGTLLHDEAAGADLRTTLGNLERSSALLAEDLEALQSNFLLRRYFKRKAKEEAKAQEAPSPPPEPPATSEADDGSGHQSLK